MMVFFLFLGRMSIFVPVIVNHNAMQSIHWHIKSFEELTGTEVYDILKLRTDVFVVEQACAYDEVDGKDKQCLHVFAKKMNRVIAYARIVPPHVSYPELSIGRVVVAADYRNEGLGHVLLQYTLDKIVEEFGEQPIQIGAQCYLKDFYEAFGFKAVSEDYLEDGIPHVDMIREVH